jgi:bifunctional DNA-binding transcriptional regulator/antitoxin component of YhaV-PrlF toxin-antitoxin module
MVKVKVWRTGRKKGSRGSLVLVIPYQLAEALEIKEGMIMYCFVDIIDMELIYKKGGE